MFDFVRSEVPLPDGCAGEFQTKDFDCEMLTHVIRADGRLILQFFGPQNDLREEDANYHGVVNFYGVIDDRWREFNAKFTDGQLVEIKAADPPRH